jgi:hypothetical protein
MNNQGVLLRCIRLSGGQLSASCELRRLKREGVFVRITAAPGSEVRRFSTTIPEAASLSRGFEASATAAGRPCPPDRLPDREGGRRHGDVANVELA